MRRGYDRVESSIGMSYDEIKGVTMSVSRDFDMLCKITTGKKRSSASAISNLEQVKIFNFKVKLFELIHYLLLLHSKFT